MAYVRKYGLNAKIVRVFNTYGPGTSSGETRVVSKFLKNALRNKMIPVEGKGSQTRTFCYVDDLVEALILIGKRGKAGEVYNAGADVEIPIKDLAKLVIKLTGSKSKIKFIKRPLHDHQARRPDLTKLKKLGWKQTVSLQDGIKKTLSNY
jgi:nucleoside-diphosphate-sugar epimerase